MSLQEKIIKTIRDVPDFPKPGILFKDITPILLDQKLCSEIVDGFIISFPKTKIDAIVGTESRGFLFGMLLANKMNVPFVMLRKSGKLPWKTNSYEYELEYGKAKVDRAPGAARQSYRSKATRITGRGGASIGRGVPFQW